MRDVMLMAGRRGRALARRVRDEGMGTVRGAIVVSSVEVRSSSVSYKETQVETRFLPYDRCEGQGGRRRPGQRALLARRDEVGETEASQQCTSLHERFDRN